MANKDIPLAPEGRTQGADTGKIAPTPGKSHPMTIGKMENEPNDDVTNIRSATPGHLDKVAEQADELRRLQETERSADAPDTK